MTYISREAVLNLIKELHAEAESPEAAEALFETHERIAEHPAADVKPVVKGEWKWNDDNGYYYCSECGAVSPREDQDGEYIDCPHFCPNCGADMRKEANDDER